MLTFRGAPALSEFRQKKLLSNLQALVPAIDGLYAEYVHFAEVGGELASADYNSLAALLTYGPKIDAGNSDAESSDAEKPQGALILVVPRPGTISPWSSKATDIAQRP